MIRIITKRVNVFVTSCEDPWRRGCLDLDQALPKRGRIEFICDFLIITMPQSCRTGDSFLTTVDVASVASRTRCGPGGRVSRQVRRISEAIDCDFEHERNTANNSICVKWKSRMGLRFALMAKNREEEIRGPTFETLVI
jgi:hypothetical protein